MDDSETLAALREACRDWLRFDNDLDPCDPDTDIFAYEREKMEITERVAALVFTDDDHFRDSVKDALGATDEQIDRLTNG